MTARTIRAERPDDVAAIHAVVSAAFGQADEADLVDRLRARGQTTVALVAAIVDDAGRETLVGHVAVSPIVVDGAPARRFGGIAPLSVAPNHQGRGVGSALVEACVERARELGHEALFLLGAPAYYRRFGFVTATVGNEYGATDAFMQLELRPGALEGVGGVARYASAFAEASSS